MMPSILPSFLDMAGIYELFALYVFGCGAPTGLRLALELPDYIRSIIHRIAMPIGRPCCHSGIPRVSLRLQRRPVPKSVTSVRRSRTLALSMKSPSINTLAVSHSLTRLTLFHGLSITPLFSDQSRGSGRSIQGLRDGRSARSPISRMPPYIASAFVSSLAR